MTLFQASLKKLWKPEPIAGLKFLKFSERSKHNLNKESPFLQLIGYLLNQGKCFFRLFIFQNIKLTDELNKAEQMQGYMLTHTAYHYRYNKTCQQDLSVINIVGQLLHRRLVVSSQS